MMYNQMMSFEDYLEHATIEDTVADILREVHPVLEKKVEATQASPWEVATALMIELSGIATAAELDRTVLLNLLAFLIDTTKGSISQFDNILHNESIRRHYKRFWKAYSLAFREVLHLPLKFYGRVKEKIIDETIKWLYVSCYVYLILFIIARYGWYG